MLLLGSAPRAGLADEPDSRAAVDFFEKSIRPVLSESCQKCHGPQKQSSELRLDSREAILKGGSSGPAIVPGKPDESLLVQAVAHSHEELKMPPKGKLPAADGGGPAPLGRNGCALGRSLDLRHGGHCRSQDGDRFRTRPLGIRCTAQGRDSDSQESSLGALAGRCLRTGAGSSRKESSHRSPPTGEP